MDEDVKNFNQADKDKKRAHNVDNVNCAKLEKPGIQLYRPSNYTKINQFFTKCNPDMILFKLLDHINDHDTRLKNGEEDLKVSQNTYKVKFKWTTPNQG